MIKARIPETGNGIVGGVIVTDYDKMQRGMRDRGLINTDRIIKAGITGGKALEIGPGPGYLGLEWLKKTENTSLFWLEISEDMKRIAEKNAKEYKLEERIHYTISDATKKFPFEDSYFDAVFTNGSLHEWAKPVETFNEMERVLKKGGRFFISDLKRNVNPVITLIMKGMTKQASMKKGLISSINSSYLKNEIFEIISNSKLKNFNIEENSFGLIITGIKE